MRASSVAAAAAALGMVAACGSEPPQGQAQGGDGRGPITYVTTKLDAETTQVLVDDWNAAHPQEKVSSVLLPESADEGRRKLIQNAQTKSGAMDVIVIDAVWTSEFAANRWVEELPPSQFDVSGFLAPAVATGKYRDKLYAMPFLTGTGLLYYRKDLVETPPKTWAELRSTCREVLAGEKGMSCYAGQFDKFEGLTVNFAEAVQSAGGSLVDASGKPSLTDGKAKEGLGFLVDGFADGLIPKEAITFQEEEGRNAFQEGKLLFYRNWAYMYEQANDAESSKVAGKFDVAPLPGLDGPGSGTLGGNNMAVSAFSENKQTAKDFIAFMTSAEQEMKFARTNSTPLARAALYEDPELVKKYPYLPALKEGILAARPRPQAVKYGAVTAAIQESVYGALTGVTSVDETLTGLQGKLGELLK